MGIKDWLTRKVSNPAQAVRVSGEAFDISDYGPPSLPPTAMAEEFRDHMPPIDKRNFDELMRHWQDWCEMGAGTSELSVHPEARACMWGLSLSKIAEHYRETDNLGVAALYMDAAWQISNYPIFANNAALLYLANGELLDAKRLIESFLGLYQRMNSIPVFRTIMGEQVSATELETLAMNARQRLSAIESQLQQTQTQ